MADIIPLNADDPFTERLRKTAVNIGTHASNAIGNMNAETAANVIPGVGSPLRTALVSAATSTEGLAQQQGISNENPTLLRDLMIRMGGMANRYLAGAPSAIMNNPIAQATVDKVMRNRTYEGQTESQYLLDAALKKTQQQGLRTTVNGSFPSTTTIDPEKTLPHAIGVRG